MDDMIRSLLGTEAPPPAETDADPVNIWSGEHGLYWRPNAQGYTGKREEAGEWPRARARYLIDGCGPEKKLALRLAVAPIPADAVVRRARDVNSRLCTAYMIYHGITPDLEWPDVQDITAEEARLCGAIVSEADRRDHEAKPAGASRTVHTIIEAERAPLYLGYAIISQAKRRDAQARAGGEA